jgi:hypothetical protein
MGSADSKNSSSALNQVLPRGFNRVALAGDVPFRAKGHVRIVLAFDDGGQSASGHHEPGCTHTQTFQSENSERQREGVLRRFALARTPPADIGRTIGSGDGRIDAPREEIVARF